MAPRRSLLSVLALASALALSACGGNAQPTASGTQTATATGSPTPTTDIRPTPASSTGPARNIAKPELPEAAKQQTKEGLEAFTQYWFDTITYALETGDSGPLKAASKPSCKMCNSYIADADLVAKGEGWNIGPKWVVRDFVTDLSRDPLGQAVGYFQIEESASTEFAKDGSVKDSSESVADEDPKAIYAIYGETGWTASEAGNA